MQNTLLFLLQPLTSEPSFTIIRERWFTGGKEAHTLKDTKERKLATVLDLFSQTGYADR
jgi:hypothetical protein